jgi:hypothetical protein
LTTNPKLGDLIQFSDKRGNRIHAGLLTDNKNNKPVHTWSDGGTGPEDIRSGNLIEEMDNTPFEYYTFVGTDKDK